MLLTGYSLLFDDVKRHLHELIFNAIYIMCSFISLFAEHNYVSMGCILILLGEIIFDLITQRRNLYENH